MQVVGYIACLLIGVSLGSIGAGGSILTVPVMVYLFHVPVIVATSYSLFIVGLTSLLGAAVNYRQANTNVRAAGLFCFVSAGVVLVIRSWLLPLIPARLFLFYGFQVTWALVSMLLFATLIFLSASAMIRRGEGKVSGVVGDGGIVGDGVMEGGGIVGGDRVMEGGGTVGGDGVMEGGGLGGDDRPRGDRSISKLVGSGIMVGVVTGLLGAGGGFILIPSLVLLLNFPVKEAIGTSLLIMSINALLGFGMDLRHMPVDWSFLGYVTVVAMAGIFLGVGVASRVSASRLKIIFGWFMVAIGVFVLAKEVIGFFSPAGA